MSIFAINASPRLFDSAAGNANKSAAVSITVMLFPMRAESANTMTAAKSVAAKRSAFAHAAKAAREMPG